MSNNETGFIKFLMLLLVLGMISGLTACQPINSQVYHEKEKDSIMGGKPVSASSVFAQRVIYLALGVVWIETPTGRTVSQTGLCTASAIAPKVLLTAAHCVAGLQASQVSAVLSLNPWNHAVNEKEWVKIEKIVIHEGYSDLTKTKGLIENDIALLKLSEALPATRISELASEKLVTATTASPAITAPLDLVAIGYGKKNALLNSADDFKKTDDSWLYFVMKSVSDFKVTSPLFSTAQTDMTGVCSGDSGGPGFIYDSVAKDFFIVGVTSFISVTEEEKQQFDPKDIYDKCMGRGNYTNVLFHKDWILRNISGL